MDEDFAEHVVAAVETACWPESSVSLQEAAWCLVRHPAAAPPAQGWKLHVSATVLTGREILARVLPVLLSKPVTFKVCRSTKHLAWLNAASGGLGQIGKFVTVYPDDDVQAVALAHRLDAATSGMCAPCVRSDRPLHDRSIVSYRYGEFRRRGGFDLLGRHESYLEAPDGSRSPEARDRYGPPSWSADPFRRDGSAVDRDGPVAIANRYVRFGLVHESPRGQVHEAVDVHLGRRCLVKSARRAEAVAFAGGDAVDELRGEAAMLARLDGRAGAPRRYAFVETDRTAELVLEEIAGASLRETVSRDVVARGHADVTAGVATARAIATDLARLHALGIVHRDVHPGNVVVDAAGRPRLIDFGMARDIRARPRDGSGFGMVGYASPQQLAGSAPSVGDDVHAFGAVLYFTLTGADLLSVTRLRLRPAHSVNPLVHPALTQVVARCLAPDPADRFASIDAARASLDVAANRPPPRAPAFGALPALDVAGDVASLVGRFVEMLDACAYARGGGCGWPATSGSMPDRGTPWLYDGDAGIVYALAELLDALPSAEPLLRRGARGLVEIDEQLPPDPDGLFVGRAGVGFTLLRAAVALADETLLTHARAIGQRLSASAPRNPDLLHGAAGRIRFQLALHAAAGDAASVDAAVRDGRWLCGVADHSTGRWEWHIPEPWGPYSAVGYAHGSAGIADVLLDLWEVTRDPVFLDIAKGVADDLARLARPALEDGTGVRWPVYWRDSDTEVAAWCHGAGGIGSFFLHCHALGVHPDALEIAARAGWTLARGRRVDPAVYCHGLAGHVELLLDLHGVTGDPRWRSEAGSVARLLLQSEMHLTETRDVSAIGPGSRLSLMTGEAGLVLALVRALGPSGRSSSIPRATTAIEVGFH